MKQESQQEKEIDLFKVIVGVLFTLTVSFVGIIYGFLKQADAEARVEIKTLQDHRMGDNARFQNLDSNIYLLCKSQKLNCIPPVKE